MPAPRTPEEECALRGAIAGWLYMAGSLAEIGNWIDAERLARVALERIPAPEQERIDDGSHRPGA